MVFNKIIIGLVCVTLAASANLINLVQDEPNKCLLSFIQKFVAEHEVRELSLIYDKDDTLSLTTMLNKLQIPHLQHTIPADRVDFNASSSTTSHHIFSIQTLRDVKQALELKGRNVEAKCLVIIPAKGDSISLSKEVIRIFRSRSIYSVGIVVYNEANADFQLFTWYPYQINNSCGDHVNPTPVGRCDGKLIGTLAMAYNKCKLIVGWFYNYMGLPNFLDMPLFSLLEEKYDLSVEYALVTCLTENMVKPDDYVSGFITKKSILGKWRKSKSSQIPYLI